MNGATNDNPVAFLLAQHQTSFEEMLPIARRLKEEKIHPIFLLEHKVGELNAQQCDKESIDKICLWDLGTKSKKKITPRFKRRLRKRVGNKIPFLMLMLWKFLTAVIEIRRQKRLAQQLIKRFSTSVILLSGDRTKGFGLPLIKEAKKRGIPTVVLSLTYSHPESCVKLREDSPWHFVDEGPFRLINRFVKNLLPHQAYKTDDGRTFLFYASWWTLAAWLYHILPQRPWYIGGGDASIIAVDSKETQQRYISYGIDKKKLIITGQPAFDDLYRVYLDKGCIRQEVIKRWHLDPKQKLLVCALPPLDEHKLLRRERHWQEIKFLVKTLSTQNANIVLNLHPRMDKDRYIDLCRGFSVTISEYPLSHILPIADVFVNVFSSTVIWAILCQIPTIIIDFYNFNFTFFDKYDGCIIERNRDRFKNTLYNILNDEKLYSQLRQNQRRSSLDITSFDGKATKRVIDLVKDRIFVNHG